AAAEQVVQRLDAVAHDMQRVGDLGLGECDARELDVVRVVLHKQDRPGAHGDPASRPAGSSTWNVLPSPGTVSTRIRPPMRATMRCAIARPSPWPPPSSGPCTRWKGSKARAAWAGSKPLPWSRTRMRTV